MPVTNVGTLDIKIQVSGQKDATESLNKLGNIDLSGLLKQFNQFRWAFLAVQTIAKVVIGPIKTFAKIAMTSFKAVAKIIDVSVIKPLGMVGDALATTLKSFTILGAGATAAVVGLGVSSVKEFSSFDEAMKNSIALFYDFGEQGSKTEKELKDQAMRVSEAWNISSEEVARGLYDMASAGLSTVESFELMNSVGQFTRATQMDVAKSTEFLLSTMRAFNMVNEDGTIQLEKVTETMDTLSKSVLGSQQKFPELMGAMGNVGSIAAAMNVDFQDVNAALMVMANAGVRGARAGTALKTVFGRLSKGTGEAKGALDSLNLSYADVNLTTNTFGEVLEKISSSFDTLTDPVEKNAVLFQLLGLRGARAARIITTEGTKDFGKFRQALEDAGGAMDEITDENMKAFANQVGQLGQMFNNLKVDIGQALGEGLIKGTDELKEGWEDLSNKVFTLFQGWGTWIGDKMPAAIQFLIDSFDKLYPAIQSLSKFLQKVFTDIGEILTTVFGDAFTWISNNFEGISRTAESVWGSIKDIILDTWSDISSYLFGNGLEGEGMFGNLIKWWDENGSKIIANIKGIFSSATTIIGSVIKAWTGVFSGFSQRSGGFLESIRMTLENIVSWLLTAGSDGATGFDRLRDVFVSIGKLLGGTFAKSVQIVNELFSSSEPGKGLNAVLENMGDLMEELAIFISSLDAEKIVNGFVNISEAFKEIASSSITDFFSRLLDIVSSEGFTESMNALYQTIKLIANTMLWLLTNLDKPAGVGLLATFGAIYATVASILRGIGSFSGAMAVGGKALYMLFGLFTMIQGVLEIMTNESGDFVSNLLSAYKVIAGMLIMMGGITSLYGAAALFAISGIQRARKEFASVGDFFKSVWINLRVSALSFFYDILTMANWVMKKIGELIEKVFGKLGTWYVDIKGFDENEKKISSWQDSLFTSMRNIAKGRDELNENKRIKDEEELQLQGGDIELPVELQMPTEFDTGITTLSQDFNMLSGDLRALIDSYNQQQPTMTEILPEGYADGVNMSDAFRAKFEADFGLGPTPETLPEDFGEGVNMSDGFREKFDEMMAENQALKDQPQLISNYGGIPLLTDIKGMPEEQMNSFKTQEEIKGIAAEQLTNVKDLKDVTQDGADAADVYYEASLALLTEIRDKPTGNNNTEEEEPQSFEEEESATGAL